MENTAGAAQRLLSWDRALTAALTLPDNPRLRIPALLVAHSGDSLVWAALLISAWFFGGDQWKARVIVTVVGLLLTEICTVLLKMITRRQRPAGTFGAFYRKTDPYSFPSGHAARAALLCILSASMGPLPAFIAVLIWSPVMVLSRIAIGIHYVLDVLVGIVMGTGISFVVLATMPYFMLLF